MNIYEEIADALGMRGPARTSFIAAIAGKSKEEIAGILTTKPNHANTLPPIVRAALARNGTSQRAIAALGALGIPVKPRTLPPNMAAIFGNAGGSSKPSGAANNDPVARRARSALGVGMTEKPGAEWVTTPSGATYHVRSRADRVRVQQIIAREQNGGFGIL